MSSDIRKKLDNDLHDAMVAGIVIETWTTFGEVHVSIAESWRDREAIARFLTYMKAEYGLVGTVWDSGRKVVFNYLGK
jgi:hypothetical protein